MSRVVPLSEKAQQHLAGWRRSGLSQAGYCRQEQLNRTTFNNWVRREMVQPISAPLTLVSAELAAFTPAVMDSPLACRLCHASGWTLDLPASMSPAQLGALLRQLA